MDMEEVCAEDMKNGTHLYQSVNVSEKRGYALRQLELLGCVRNVTSRGPVPHN